MDAAEQLLDEAGIDGTTGAAIIEAAGNRNAAAVNYHFGNLDALIRAVLDRRAAELDETRHGLLDQLEASGTTDPRSAFLAMIAPLAALLDRCEGRRYLRLLNQAANHPRFRGEGRWEFTSSVERGAALLLPLVAALPPDLQRHRSRNVLGFVLYAFAEQARAIDAGEGGTLGTDDFTADLADSALAALSA